MKFTKLLVLGAMLLSGSSAWAALDSNGERVKPEPATVAFQIGTETEVFYLYNTSAKMFFTQGNSWGTRGCVGPYASAVKMYFSESGQADGSYVINDYICIRSTNYLWKLACAAGEGQDVYTDQSTSWGRPYWMIVPDAEGNGFRIKNTTVGEEAKFMGRDNAVKQDFGNAYAGFTDDKQRFPLSNAIEEGEGHYVDWALVAPDAYEAVGPAILTYEAADALLTLIKEAESIGGIDVTSYRTLYANEEASLEELNAAATQLASAIEQRKKDLADDAYNNATGTNPADVTEKFITNPYYDGNATGWTSSIAPAVNGNGAEYYEKKFSHYQELTLSKGGVYAIGVQGYNRPGFADAAYTSWKEDAATNTKFFLAFGADTTAVNLMNPFANARTETIGTGGESTVSGLKIPNDMASGKAYFDAGLYKNIQFFNASDNQSVKVGLENNAAIGGDWTMFDNWSLIYYGTGADAFQKWAEVMAAAAPEYTTDAVTAALVEAYNAIKNDPKATNEAEVKSYLANLEAARAAVAKNIELWANYEEEVQNAEAFLKGYKDKGQGSLRQVQILDFYLSTSSGPMPGFYENGTAPYIIQARALDNDGLVAEIAFLAKLKKDVIDNVDVQPGTDMTARLSNPAFDTNDWKGWTREYKNAGNFRVTEKCAEAWKTESFDLYQKVSDMPVGVYEISVQGFSRYLGASDGYSYYQKNPNVEVPSYIYMNDNTTLFKNVFSEPRDKAFYEGLTDIYAADDNNVFPDNMPSSARAFGAGMYMNSAFGAVFDASEEMRIGVKGSTIVNNDACWVIFDNFKLTFWGTQIDKVNEALNAVLPEVESMQQGRMGKNVKNEIEAAINAAQEALAAQNGEAMFAALKNLYTAKAKVASSKALMDKLAAVNDSLNTMINATQMEMVLVEAQALYDQIDDKLYNKEVSDEEVAGYIDQIHAQMAIVKKCVTLRNEITKLEAEVSSVTEEQKQQGDVSEKWITDANQMLASLTNDINTGMLDLTKVDEFIEQIKIMISTKFMPADMNSATDQNPVVCTKMLKSPNFSTYSESTDSEVASLDGWTYTSGYEAQDFLMLGYYNKTFDVWQELVGIPNGTYEVKAQAYYRFGTSQEDADMFFQTKADSSNVFLYAMSENVTSSVPVKLLASGGAQTQIGKMEEVMDEGTGETTQKFVPSGSQVRIAIKEEATTAEDSLYVPNNVEAAAAFFKEQVEDTYRFENSVIVKVTDGTLRVGIKKATGKSNDWTIIDNFRLFYYGAESTKEANGDPSGIESTASGSVLRTEYFTLNGMRSVAPQRGINIMRQTLSDGTVVVKKVNLK